MLLGGADRLFLTDAAEGVSAAAEGVRSFRRWSKQGKFEQMRDRLRTQWREWESRAGAPTAAVFDAQSTCGSPQGGDTGHDAGKRVKGLKRHLVVDTLGLLLLVTITAASVQGRDSVHRPSRRPWRSIPVSRRFSYTHAVPASVRRQRRSAMTSRCRWCAIQ